MILVVDDEPSWRATLEGLLLPAGYNVLFASGGVEAMASVAAQRPDAIVLDLLMPDMSGFEVCRRLRARPEWAPIPILLCTELDRKAVLPQGLAAGADDLLAKPIDGTELRARLRTLLRARRQHDQREHEHRELELALKRNEELTRALEQRLDQLAYVLDVGLQIMRDPRTTVVTGLIPRAALRLAPCPACCVLHFPSHGEDGALVSATYTSGRDGPPEINAVAGLDRLATAVMAAGEPVYIADAPGNSLIDSCPDRPIGSVISHPLVQEGQAWGVLSVCCEQPGAFDEHFMQLLARLANQAGVAIANAKFIEAQEMARERERQRLKDLFRRYVSPAVADRIVEGDAPVVGGERQEISVLFADIRSFTRYAETQSPEHLIEVLNRYLHLAVQSIMAEEGTLDKIMGDALMAVFNAPVPQEDHALRAARTALAMQAAIAEYNRAVTDDVALQWGIGLSLGPAIVGNIGAEQQMNFTAIGDVVNLAQRLQEKAEAGQILMSERMYRAVDGTVRARDLGLIKLRGRSASVRAYLLLGMD